MEKRIYNIGDRLINFSVSIINISKGIYKNSAGRNLEGQIVRSGTSVSLNYGEAQSAESRKDFIHKMKVVLKELKETRNCLKIIRMARLHKVQDDIIKAEKENEELIAIIFKSIETASKNLQ